MYSLPFFLLLVQSQGEMQKHYVHSVPRSKPASGSKNRIVVVFRSGDKKMVAKDTGTEQLVLHPPEPRKYIFGSCIAGLVEGYTYSRRQLMDMRAHS